MELPIQLKFFKKIELYQDYKFEQKKSLGGTRLKSWELEKKILKWTKEKHHHLGSPLSLERIKKEILNEDHPETQNAMSSLVARGYAGVYPDSADAVYPICIKINRAGLLMGEVIGELESSKFLIRSKYPIFST